MKSCLLVLCTALFSAFPLATLYSQESPKSYVVKQLSDSTKPHIWVVDTFKEREKQEKLSDAGSKRFIVKFRNQPFGAGRQGARINAAESINDEHQQFLRDLKRIEGGGQGARVSEATDVLYDYRKAFNGFAIIASSYVKSEIEKLEYVHDVYEDREVKAIGSLENEKVNVPSVWSGFGVTGTNIKIGIIDTGIDYNHQDLGSGFGAGFRVKGGYDFVNEDDDPMDDNGHGTHVAGIAAGNGITLKGAAPGAELYAYKVLNQYGNGWDSWILAAIERVLDPDQNPATDDALDVVNMSLGRSPVTDDPLAEAVNNAVSQGVVFVVAAGNEYGYGTVGAPGVAANALTVGATSLDDFTADFSSKGPVMDTHEIKPDVAAPGVDVYSSFPGGKYSYQSGTSMASPLVAGVAALLLDAHPDWSPEMVKAALMNTADNTHNALIWDQGAGRINAYDAINTETIVSPATLSLGMTSDDAIIQKTFLVTIHNLSSVEQNFSLWVEGEISNPAISVSFSPASKIIAAKSAAVVQVTFAINPASLPFKSYPESYSGSVVISGNTLTRVPVALLRPLATKLTFEGELPAQVFVVGINGSDFWQSYRPQSSEMVLFLPHGQYDIITTYAGYRYVITEDVVVHEESNPQINLSKEQALNRVLFNPLDRNGNPISTEYKQGITLFTGDDRNFTTLYFGLVNEFYISNQSHYGFTFKMNDWSSTDPGMLYDIGVASDFGISESSVVSNDPDELTELTIINPGIAEGDDQEMIYYNSASYFGTWNTFPVWAPNPIKIFQSPYPQESVLNGSKLLLQPASGKPGYVWETGSWKIEEPGQLSFYANYWSKITTVSTDGHMDYRLGGTLLRFNCVTNNQSDKILLTDYPHFGTFVRHYGDREYGSIYYQLLRRGSKVKQGVMLNDIFTNSSFYDFEEYVEPDEYTLVLRYEHYQVRGKFGIAEARMEFDLRNGDKDAPAIGSLSIEVDGKSTDQIDMHQTAYLKASFNEWCYGLGGDCGVASDVSDISVELKNSGSAVWTNLTYTRQYNDIIAEIPQTLDAGYYALRITVTDYSGNSLTYTLDPGFLKGGATASEPYITVSLIEPYNGNRRAGNDPVFRWSSVDNAQAYTIQISETDDFTVPLIEASVTNNSYHLPQPLMQDKKYYWRVRAAGTGVNLPWSNVFAFTTSPAQNVVLQAPLDNATVQPLQVDFSWLGIDGNADYYLELSQDDFMSVLYHTYVSGTAFRVEKLEYATEYFWRVSYYDFDQIIPQRVYSEVFSFTTASKAGTHDDDDNDSDNVTGIGSELASTTMMYSTPNPFSSETHVVFEQTKPGPAYLVISDAMGRELNRVVSEFNMPGVNRLTWDGKDHNGNILADGLYYGVVNTPSGTGHVKMLLKK